MPVASPTPSSEPKTRLVPRVLRLPRAILLFAVLLLVVAFAGTHLFAPNADAEAWPIRLLFAVAFITGPAMAFSCALRKRPQTWPPYATLALSLGLLVVWLRQDDPVLRHPPGSAALRSDFPNAAATYALTLRYSRNTPGSLDGTVKYPSKAFFKISPLFDKPEKDREWIAFVTENRTHIEARWDELAPVRVWVEEMAAAPELADLTQGFAYPMIAFPPLREVSQYANARALLHALDGRPDEALGIILPVFTAAQKLEFHGRTATRRMVTIVLQKNALTALRIVLDHSEVSPAARARIAAALAPIVPAEENARLLFLCEYETSTIAFGKLLEISPVEAAEGVGFSLLRYSPLYNHNATMNLAGDLANDLAALAARRDLDGVKTRQRDFFNGLETGAWPRKNQIGANLLNVIIPSFEKVGGNFWEAQDYRTALLKRL